MDRGMDGSISIGLCLKWCLLDVHVGCATESVGLTMDDGRCVAVCNIWHCRLWEVKNCIRTKTQNYMQQPEIESFIVSCEMPAIWLHPESKWRKLVLLWNHHIWEAENKFTRDISWSVLFSLH
jgi:hypothetical protein